MLKKDHKFICGLFLVVYSEANELLAIVIYKLLILFDKYHKQ